MDPQLTDKRLTDYIRPLIARKWLIVVAVLVATGGVYAYYARMANVYTATTHVYVVNAGDPVTGVQNIQATDRQVEDQATLLDSRSTAALVAAQIGYHGSADSLLNSVSLTSLPGQDFVQITAQAGSAREAAAVANGFGQAFVSLVTNANKTRIARALALTKAQLATLGPANFTADLTRSDLVAQLQRLQLAQRDPQVISQLVQAALPPAAPSSPKPIRNALFALAISLFAAIAAAYGLERFDRRLKDPEEMERAYGRPLLAVLPHANEPSPVHGGEAALSFDFREPFRVLRSNLELATLDTKLRTIVVSSAMPGEGKSTVVRNLALAFRESGRSVAVVDLDLRHPSLPRLFGVADGVGMTEVLRHEVSLEQALLPIRVELHPFEAFMRAHAAKSNGSNGSNGSHGLNGSSNGNGTADHPEVSVLLSGARPANPAGVLGSDRVVEVLDALRERFDVVVIDSAPVLAVSDTVPLLRYADAVLFVGRMNVTTRDTAKRLLDFSARLPDMSLTGIVANDLSRLEAGGYGYGYGYGYGSEVDSPAQPSAGAGAPSPATSRAG